MQINSNGYLVFGPDHQVGDRMIRGPFPSINQVAAIALFNCDIDFNAYSPGFLSYRLDTTPAVLTRATDAVMAIGQYAQELPDFQASWTLVVTWHAAAFYGGVEVNQTEVSVQIKHCSHACRSWTTSSISQKLFSSIRRNVIIVCLQ